MTAAQKARLGMHRLTRLGSDRYQAAERACSSVAIGTIRIYLVVRWAIAALTANIRDLNGSDKVDRS